MGCTIDGFQVASVRPNEHNSLMFGLSRSQAENNYHGLQHEHTPCPFPSLMLLRYFARIADERMAKDDQAILVTHQPRWLSDWFWDETACHNLRQLVRGHLRGRARVHLAGAFLILS